MTISAYSYTMTNFSFSWFQLDAGCSPDNLKKSADGLSAKKLASSVHHITSPMLLKCKLHTEKTGNGNIGYSDTCFYRALGPLCHKVLKRTIWLIPQADWLSYATYCPGRLSQLEWKNITKHCDRVDLTLCIELRLL